MSLPFFLFASSRVFPSIFSNCSLSTIAGNVAPVLHRGRVLRDLVLLRPVLREPDLHALDLADLVDGEVGLEVVIQPARLEHLLHLRGAGGMGAAGVASCGWHVDLPVTLFWLILAAADLERSTHFSFGAANNTSPC